jgi:hypothetical protein
LKRNFFNVNINNNNNNNNNTKKMTIISTTNNKGNNKSGITHLISTTKTAWRTAKPPPKFPGTPKEDT